MLKLYYKDKMYEIKVQSIAFDGCHKIYLITDNNEADEAKSYGYKLVPVGYLNAIWESACPLRFIEFWDVKNLKGNIIPQCRDAEIQVDPINDITTIIPEDGVEIDFLEDYFKAGVVCYA